MSGPDAPVAGDDVDGTATATATATDTDTDTDTADSPATPAEGWVERTAADGAGAFWRDATGTWRYRLDGVEVPGATDVTLGDLFAPPVELRGDAAVRVVPRAWASRHPDHPLAWAFEHAELGARDAIEVPDALWQERAGRVVAMAAPDLHPHNLIGVDGVAAVAGVSEATVRSYLARAQMPPPVHRVGGSPVWSRPVVERWLRARQGQKRRSAAVAALVGEAEDAVQEHRDAGDHHPEAEGDAGERE